MTHLPPSRAPALCRRGGRRRLALLLLLAATAFVRRPLLSAFAAGGAGLSGEVAARPAAGPTDLLVVGAGYLGRLVARQWQEKHPEARVVGATRTESTHAELRALGLEPRTVGADLAAAVPEGGFPYVVFCAPPGASSGPAPGSYEQAVADSLRYWSASPPSRGFVFTSSGGVFVEDSGGTVSESSAVSTSPRSAPILGAERTALAAGGTALRLAGLYDVDRGAHAYWFKSGTVMGDPDGFLNLVHYEDAAGAVVSALEHGVGAHGSLFLIGDGVPITRKGILEAAQKAPSYANVPMPAFVPAEGAAQGGRTGKIYDVRRSRDVLHWTPRYKSFGSFMAAQR